MSKSSLTTKQVIIRIVAIVSLVEFLIMLAFGFFDHGMNIYVQASIDIVVLAAISTPLIVILVINPFVNARDQALEQLNYLAQTDPLTNLQNRRSIDFQLHKFLAGSVRHKFFGAVLLIDLDGFKSINDTYGHEAGDTVLVEIASRLRSRVRADEVAGRFGGDEFILLINNLGTDEQIARNAVLQVAEQLVTLLSASVNYKDEKLSIGASIGIRMFGSDEIETESVIKDADKAMYQAKEAGKGQCVVYEV